jgi:hypothetical protein
MSIAAKIRVAVGSAYHLKHRNWRSLVFLEEGISKITYEVRIVSKDDYLLGFSADLLQDRSRMLPPSHIEAAHRIVNNHDTLSQLWIVEGTSNEKGKGQSALVTVAESCGK